MAKTRPRIASLADGEARSAALDIWQAGGVVAVPTETVYGLAGDAMNAAAIAAIYRLKGRPAHNPLICHISDMAMAEPLVDIPPTARRLAEAFWPGPLTLVLAAKAKNGLASRVTAGLDTVALRMPAEPFLRALIKALGRPLAAPSANRSGRLSPTTAEAVAESLGGGPALILDGGPTELGLESTIIDARGDPLVLLRPGMLSPEEITAASGLSVNTAAPAGPLSAPGQLASHYAPRAPLRLNATAQNEDELLIGFGRVEGTLTLSRSGNLSEAARRLFATLQAADNSGARRLAVAPIPETGLGIAINDRLRRAAAPRSEDAE